MKKHLPWFKHYSNASSGETLTLLWSNGDVEAVALWWVVLELIAKYEDRENSPGQCTVNWRILARETFWKPSKCRRVIARICAVSKLEMTEKQSVSPTDLVRSSAVSPKELDEKREGNVTFLLRNWLEFQERRGGKRDANSASKHPPEERGEKREERSRSESSDSAVSVSENEPIPDLAAIWNNNCGSLPKIRSLTASRRKAWAARYRELPDAVEWVRIVQLMAASPYCRGEQNRSGPYANWKATVTFLLRPDTHVKVLEGAYGCGDVNRQTSGGKWYAVV